MSLQYAEGVFVLHAESMSLQNMALQKEEGAGAERRAPEYRLWKFRIRTGISLPQRRSQGLTGYLKSELPREPRCHRWLPGSSVQRQKIWHNLQEHLR